MPTAPDNAASLTSVMDAIHELWADEGCDASLRFEESYYGNPPSWSLDLFLDTTNNHEARSHLLAGFDEATFRWAFYGDTAEESAAMALSWLRDLATFKEGHDA